MRVSSLLREPLLHFLLIGALLFLFHGTVAVPSDQGNRITVDRSLVAALAGQFQAVWSRPPSAQEMQGLVDGYIRDEVLYREGVAIGLAQDDPVIKRRVRQKLEVLIEDEGDTGAPGDAELGAYLERHPGKFRQPAVLSFEQVLFDPADLGDALESTLASARTALEGGAAAASQGKRSMLPAIVEQQALDGIGREFGDDFAQALEAAPVGQWWGPVRSGFGVHLVRVSARKPAYLPALDEVRKAVAAEWESERRTAGLEARYARLRAQYDVVVEGEPAQAAPR